MDTLRALKQEIVSVSRQAYENKLFVGTSGNLSVYVEEEALMLITPTSIRYETMTHDDIVVMKLDGTIVAGKHPPSSEWRMHAAVLSGCKKAKAVFHTHSPYATAFATVRKDVPVILIEMTPFLGGDIRCADFAAPGSEALGRSALEVLNIGRHGCLLSSHGTLTVGEDLATAYIRAEYLEEAAMIYHHALQVGTPFTM